MNAPTSDPRSKLTGRFVVSATRPGLPVAVPEEIPHTRQVVSDEATAARIVFARNRAEQQANPVTGGIYRWRYCPEEIPFDTHQGG